MPKLLLLSDPAARRVQRAWSPVYPSSLEGLRMRIVSVADRGAFKVCMYVHRLDNFSPTGGQHGWQVRKDGISKYFSDALHSPRRTAALSAGARIALQAAVDHLEWLGENPAALDTPAPTRPIEEYEKTAHPGV